MATPQPQPRAPHPEASPRPNLMNPLRPTLCRRAVSLAGGDMDRLADSLVGTAAADICDRCIDVLIGGVGLFGEQGSGGHDHPALAVTALRNLSGDPGFLQRMGAVLRKSLDSGNAA